MFWGYFLRSIFFATSMEFCCSFILCSHGPRLATEVSNIGAATPPPFALALNPYRPAAGQWGTAGKFGQLVLAPERSKVKSVHEHIRLWQVMMRERASAKGALLILPSCDIAKFALSVPCGDCMALDVFKHFRGQFL